MQKKIISACALALCCALAQASPLPAYPFVTASGKADLWLAPDVGEIQFEVNVQDVSSEQAAGVAARMSDELIAVFTQLGIAPEDIAAFDVKKKSLELSHPARDGSPLSYVIGRHFQLRVRDLAQWPALIAALLARNNIDSISVAFDRIDRAAIDQRLAGEAANKARAFGSGLADAFGRRLGPVMAISTGQFEHVGLPFGFASKAPARSGGAPTDPANYAVPVAIPFIQTVNAVFKLK
ncbi:MAG: SIMPL domain-containing protein [Pseudomonadota bacterium]